MGAIGEHCIDCDREIGAPFRYVHEWLDELQAEYGPWHRVFRHHVEGVERVRARWGDEAAKAAEIHIRRDCNGSLPSRTIYKSEYGRSLDGIDLEYEYVDD